MAYDVELSLEAKEEAIKKLDEAKEILEAEGIDGTQFILNHLSGKDSSEQEANGPCAPGREQAKRSAILILKKKNGDSE